jgi:hypothetical protein
MAGDSFLKDLQPGVFILAVRDSDGHDIPCLVTSVDAHIVRARVITIQLDLEFDAQTGIGDCNEGGYSCHAKLPPDLPDDVREGLFSIDRKYRFGDAPEGSRLLEHEKRALLFFFETVPKGGRLVEALLSFFEKER